MDWIDMAQDRTAGGCCDCVNEPRGSITCEVFLDYLRTVSMECVSIE
jgi:hypothetical protein